MNNKFVERFLLQHKKQGFACRWHIILNRQIVGYARKDRPVFDRITKIYSVHKIQHEHFFIFVMLCFQRLIAPTKVHNHFDQYSYSYVQRILQNVFEFSFFIALSAWRLYMHLCISENVCLDLDLYICIGVYILCTHMHIRSYVQNTYMYNNYKQK